MTITLKNVPAALHRTLKRQAKEEKRSLNQDLIKYLEEKAGTRDRQKAFAEAIRYRNQLAHQGVKVSKRLDPVKIIRELRDGR
jgi:cysteinyl-tRNA synthetase